MAKKFSELREKMSPESLERSRILAECLKIDMGRPNPRNPIDHVYFLEPIVAEIGWGNAIHWVAKHWGDRLELLNLPREHSDYWVDPEILKEVGISPTTAFSKPIDRLCFIADDCGIGSTICFLQCAYRTIKKELEEHGKSITMSSPEVAKAWKGEYDEDDPSSDLKRITADFSPEAYHVLTELSESLKVTKGDVLRKALGSLQFLDQHMKEGWELRLTKGEETKAITKL